MRTTHDVQDRAKQIGEVFARANKTFRLLQKERRRLLSAYQSLVDAEKQRGLKQDIHV